MFNEQARAYGRANVDLIAVPRAAGTSHERWMVAGAMAAIVSGSYVVSANRAGSSRGSPNFGGLGFAFSPTGELISQTSSADPVMTFELDLAVSRKQKASYPCYVRDRFTAGRENGVAWKS
jgi:N-carbamoylputrescine amidase